MEIIGYIASALIGISLGLIGGGGSILTVPVLVYLFGVDVVTATAYSLFVVGVSSLVGAATKFKRGFINIKLTLLFGLPSITSVFITRRFIVPAIPADICVVGEIVVTKSLLVMLLFAVFMILASYFMIKDNAHKQSVSDTKVNMVVISFIGLSEGFLTGLVGAGGGFLIIPALVLFAGLPMKQAVATSLLIIAAKSLIGFTGDLLNININWQLLISVSSIAILGIFVGNYLFYKIEGFKLKKTFGWFILLMGLYIIIKELFLK